MKEKELTTEGEFKTHQKEDWRTAHNIWANIKNYIDQNTLRFVSKSTPANITAAFSLDTTWRDLDLTGYTSARAIMVRLAVQVTSGTWFYLYTRKKGPSYPGNEYQGIYASEILDSGSGACGHQNIGGMIDQEMDSGQVIQYKGNPNGVATIYVVGYWETLA